MLNYRHFGTFQQTKICFNIQLKLVNEVRTIEEQQQNEPG